MEVMMVLNCKIQYFIENDNWSDWIEAEIEFNENGQVESILLDVKAKSNIFKVFFKNQPSYFHLILQDGQWYVLQQDELSDYQVKVFDGIFIDESQIFHPLEKLSELIKSIPIGAAYIQQIFKTEEPINEAIVTETDLYIKYAKKLEQDIIAIIEKHKDRSRQVQELKNYLQTTYEIIQGTGLDYVATPDIVATQAMIEIAKIVAKEQGISVIEVLMPGVAYDSSGDFVDLREMDIQEVIRTHHFSKKDGQLYLIPVRCLENYARNPDEKNHYPYFHEDLNDYQLFTKDDYEHLFHHSKETEDVHEGFEELKKLSEESINLYQQLTQLGEILKKNDAQHAGEEIDAGGGAYYSVGSFFDYYAQLEPCQFIRKESPPSLDDLAEGNKMAYIYFNKNLYFLNRYNQTELIKQITKENQYARFELFAVYVDKLPITHSERPLIVKDSQDDFYLFGKDDTPIKLHQEKILPIYESFPKQTNHVIHLNLESIAPSVFQEIFNQGFHQTSLSTEIDNQFPENKRLSLNELNWIGLQTDHFYTDDYLFVPDDIREILNKLRSFLLHPFEFYSIQKEPWDSTIRVETNIKTCIATLGTALRMNIPKHQQKLMLVGTFEELKKEKIKNIKENLDESIQMLVKSQFIGRDKNLKLSIESIESLLGDVIFTELSILKSFDLKGLTPKHLKFSNLDDDTLLQYIFYYTTEDELKLILPSLVQCISEDFRAAFIDNLEKNIDIPTEYFNKILICIPLFITDSKCLGKIHQFIQFYSIDIYELIGEEKIQGLLNNADDFLNIYVCLKEEQQNTFFNKHKHLLHINLKNKTVIGLFAYLNPSQKQIFLSQIKISEFITDTEELFLILQFLENPQFSDVLNEHKKVINPHNIEGYFIKNAIHSTDNATEISQALKDSAWPISLKGFHSIIKELDASYQSIFFETFRVNLKDLIHSKSDKDDLKYLLEVFPSEERLSVYFDLLKQYPNLFDATLIQQFINSEEKAREICQALKNSDWPKNLEEYRFLLNKLNTNHQSIFFESFRDRLKDLIPKNCCFNDLKYVLEAFPGEDRWNVYQELLKNNSSLSNYFSNMILIFKMPENFRDFKQNYDSLSIDLKYKYLRYFETFKRNVLDKIQNHNELDVLIKMYMELHKFYWGSNGKNYLIKKNILIDLIPTDISISLLSDKLKQIQFTISSNDFLNYMKTLPKERICDFYVNLRDCVEIHSKNDLENFIFSRFIHQIGENKPLLIDCLGEFIKYDMKNLRKINRELIVTKDPLFFKNIENYITSKDWQLKILSEWINDENMNDIASLKKTSNIYDFLRNHSSKNLTPFDRQRLGVCFANGLASIPEKDLACENELDKALSYVVIAQKYIQKLEHDLNPYLYELKKPNEFSKLTQEKLTIMTESLKILAQEGKNINDVKIYLKSQEKTLSKHRDQFLMKYFHRFLRDGLYFIYDCLGWMLGYPPTTGMKPYLFSKKNSKPDISIINKPKGH